MTDDQIPKPPAIVETLIDSELSTSFLSYAMSVIVSRALPDVRDGLKPVHRRILYAMQDLGLASNRSYRKSARIVGEVLGKYHPHGDSAVYDSMVRLAQPFSLRYPLVDGQGNFGSMDGDRAAAMRYTEARMAKAAEAILEDIDKKTVSYVPNFDDSLEEPSVLPGKFPYLLVNGSTGIAVGMATNLAPHNLKEITAALIALIDNPELEYTDLMNYVTGPDFPTGALICGRSGIAQAYKTGHGKVYVRAKTHQEVVHARQAIIVDEIPYQVNKAMLIEQIANLVKDKVIEGIFDIRDESDRNGVRMVIELKKDGQPDIILNQLFKHTRLQVTFSIANLCLVDSVPKILTLKELLQHHIAHRFDVVTKRIEFDLKKAKDRAHILEGLKKAIDAIDLTIKIIRGSSSVEQARNGLMEALEIDHIQAQAILDMRLQKLTGLEREKLIDEFNQLLLYIANLEEILAVDQKRYDIIKEELQELSDKFGDERRTQIIDGDIGVDDEDLIEDEDVVVTITKDGYIKRIGLDTYRAQNRGGRGIVGTTTKDDDIVNSLFVTRSKAFILFFTNTGRVHWKKVYQIPEGSRQAKGRAIVNLLALEKDEFITASIPVQEFTEGSYLVLCTKKGTVKKSSLQSYARPRAGGIRAIVLNEGDELIRAVMTNGEDQLLIATKNGLAVRFHEKDARELGRVSQGVRGIRLQENDHVIDMVVAAEDKTLLTITENGYGKRTPIPEYRLIGRGGKGVININCSQRNGPVVAIKVVDDETGLLFISQKGIVMRTRADQISVIGRNTQGVRIMRLDEDDIVVACARIVLEEVSTD
ncbi:MAG: DNA gyrase subunit A [Candidatus Woesearchaeota archaeon]